MQDLIDFLAQEVRQHYDNDDPVRATNLGNVLGAAFRDRGLPTGKGAFSPLVRLALEAGAIRRVRLASGPDLLLPVEASVPDGAIEISASSRGPNELGSQLVPSHVVEDNGPLGLPRGVIYLRPAIFRAFAGMDAPRFADLSSPPRLAIMEAAAADESVPVEPVAPARIRSAWKAFAEEAGIDPDAAARIEEGLGDDAHSLWKRVEIPGDDEDRRWGVRFNRRRQEMVLAQMREWAAKHEVDLTRFHLADNDRLPPALRPVIASIPKGSDAGIQSRGSHVDRMRRRLKAIVDRMTIEQLCELRVPAEFLLDSPDS